MSYRIGLSLLGSWLFVSSFVSAPARADEPFKLGVEQRTVIQNQAPPASYPSYPAYPSYPTYAPPAQPRQDKKPPKPPKRLEATAAQSQMPVQPPPQQQRPPMTAAIAAPGVLPGEFLGVWQVLGSRSSIEAQPQFQEGVQNIFQATTSDTWTIQGNPQQGYSLASSTGVSTQLSVDRVQGSTAFIRYQHPIKNTVAQEAIVMQLGPGGASFQGLERISILKQGEPQPRCKVTYQLSGRRQR